MGTERVGRFLGNEMDGFEGFEVAEHFVQKYRHDEIFVHKFLVLEMDYPKLSEKLKEAKMVFKSISGTTMYIAWELDEKVPTIVYSVFQSDSKKLKELNSRLAKAIEEGGTIEIDEELSEFIDWDYLAKDGEFVIKPSASDERKNLPYKTNYVVVCSVAPGGKFEEFVEWYRTESVDPQPNMAKKDMVFMLSSNSGGFTLKPYELDTETYGLEIIKDNYNDDFSDAYDRIIKFLEKDSSGICLLPGLPGTGKTSIIQHLAGRSEELNKRFVILPSAFVGILSDPTFTEYAANNLKDTVLCIEDAEEILKDRKTSGSAHMAVTNILNISDGILGKIIKLKVLCTLNNDKEIDPALERKGRLKVKYTFDKLEADKATKLSEKLGINKVYSTPTTLADVYNEKDVVMYGGSATQTKKIGFGK